MTPSDNLDIDTEREPRRLWWAEAWPYLCAGLILLTAVAALWVARSRMAEKMKTASIVSVRIRRIGG